MSKIEKALLRASAEQHSAPPGLIAALRGGRSLVTGARYPAPVAEIGSAVHARREISRMREARLLDSDTRAQYRIIYPELAEDETVQAFRELRTRILQQTRGHNGVILVAGVTAESGGTFVALNLSAAFAFDAGRTALLIDCNLRDPFVHWLCPDGDNAGLTDYFENGDMDLSRIIHPVGIERLRVIPAGSRCESPSEYFASPRMGQLLAAVRERYPERFVVIDAPPMSADSQILAELCDYVLLVVPYGKVTGAQLENCIQTVDDKRLLGVVFNDEPRLPVLPWRRFLTWPLEGLRSDGFAKKTTKRRT